ncbi:MAG TPA: metal-dependent transcriptional regulator [Actinomycetota bacterium]|jgi:DtxR family transcriptional regulator, Mn-dependent transcriptional regulator|nr:metal-dependent transcriptional regulator [Actinomycetota bacterium]
MPRLATPAAQDYLKALVALEPEGGGLVATTAVASRLGVSAASATNMLKRLHAMGLVRHVPYHGAEIEDAGRRVALEVIRHHRLLETYLNEALGMPWDEVHAEAEVLEHVISEDLEDRIAARLGHPTADPHGDPIPTKDGSMPEAATRTLWGLEMGVGATVRRVSDSEPGALRYLGSAGVVPGARVEVASRAPLHDGPLLVRVEGAEEPLALSREISEGIWVD